VFEVFHTANHFCSIEFEKFPNARILFDASLKFVTFDKFSISDSASVIPNVASQSFDYFAFNYC
jgi:hypothetical protein